MKDQYVNEVIPSEAAPRGWSEIEGDERDVTVVKMLVPFKSTLKDGVLTIQVDIGKFPAPMFSDALIKHCTETLGKFEGGRVLEALGREYYRQLCLKQMQPA